ncbi:hypothetical protein BDV97DRAFT_365753 [Delphinella strobiligena]|nr:hypothetical protein BDV97DRAFT_365753 [Delphinella strobiligena]
MPVNSFSSNTANSSAQIKDWILLRGGLDCRRTTKAVVQSTKMVAVCEDETDSMRYINNTKVSRPAMIRLAKTGLKARLSGETVYLSMLDLATETPVTQDCSQSILVDLGRV